MSFEILNQLPSPREIKEKYPLSEELKAIKAKRDEEITKIITGEDQRLLLIIGPCSADSEEPVIDYVKRFMAYHASNGVKVAIDNGDVDSKTYFQTVMKKYKEEYFKLNINYPERIKEFRYLLDM